MITKLMIDRVASLPIGAASAHVAELQSELDLSGYYPGKIDGILGPKTLAAIERWRALNLAPPKPVAIVPSSFADEIMAMALRMMIGLDDVREDEGSNRGDWPDAFAELAGADSDDPQPWCARAAWGCHDIGARLHGHRLAKGQRSGSVQTSWDRATQRHTAAEILADPALLRAGMLAIRRADGGGRCDHVELVIGVADGWLHTIGGNTNAANSREGDGVYEHPRWLPLDSPRFVGVIAPVYEARARRVG